MEKHFGGDQDVRPAVVINHTTFAAGSATPLRNGENSNVGVPEPDEDGFLTGTSHGAKTKKKAKKVTEGVKMLLDVFTDKWEEDKERAEAARKEDNENTRRMLQTIEAYQKTVDRIGTAFVDALNKYGDRSAG